jgi:type II secretory pathway component GspD/PulD (secretin)
LRKFREDIRQFDKPAAQIMIDILMVEITDTGQKDLESLLRWQNAGRGFQTDTALGTLTLRGVATLPEDFANQLQALVAEGKARVRANPSIATVSGHRATIFIGQQRFLSTPVQVGIGRIEQINFIDAGVRLEITPWTGDGKAVIAEIQAEVSTMGAPDPVTGLPDKTVRQASTIVRVLDGETIVIGGLRQSELRERRGKIPILGDLPVVGHLFRSQHTERTDTDLILFITPRVLSLTGHLPAAEEEALKRRLEEAQP